MRMLVAAAVALAFAGSARAADLPVKAPPPVLAAPTWTGWYIGINGGGAWGKTDPSVSRIPPDTFFNPANVPAVTADGSSSFNNSGALLGGQIGYLYQAGPAIFGLEAGFDWMSVKGSTSSTAVYPASAPFTYSWNSTGKSDFLFTLLGRVGPDMGTWYPYITGGLAVAHLKYNSTFTDTWYPGGSNVAISKDKLGYAIGGGVEWRVAPRWLLRGEYLYLNFDHIDGTSRVCDATCFVQTTFSYRVKFKENIGRVALSYQW